MIGKRVDIDYEKCIGCMKCVDICPFTALLEGDESTGSGESRECDSASTCAGKPIHNMNSFCVGCLHCAAVCETGAISFEGKSAIADDAIGAVSDGIGMTDDATGAVSDAAGTADGSLGDAPENDFAESLKTHIVNRRSIRHFEDRPVDRALLEECIAVSDWAPSAKNQKAVGWIVVDSPAIIEKMMEHILDYVKETGISPEIISNYERGTNLVMGQARTLIFAYAPDNVISPETDTAIAMETLELYLQAKGIGTCWAGYLKRMANAIPEIKELIQGPPEGCSFYGAFMAGYPAEEYIKVPARPKSKITFV